MKKIAVFGSGSWGTAISLLLVRAGHKVSLIGIFSDEIELMKRKKENIQYLPGCFLPDEITPTTDLKEIDAEAVFVSVPSHAVRESARLIKPYLRPGCIMINTAKGLEENTGLRLSQVLEEELPGHPIAVLSGPSHAEEVGRDVVTAVAIAAKDIKVAETVQDLIMTSKFRVYTNLDMIGVEMGGSLKNIVALCTGILDGMNPKDNTKAALMTRGLAEMTRLGVAMGGQPETFYGLAGIGDLIVTCTSLHSRNLRAGRALGAGKPLDEVLREVGMVVEGVRATKVAFELSKKYGISMPITEQAYKVLFEGLSPSEALENLMMRGRKHETEDMGIFGR
ncbi:MULTISPECIES: NAD(P)H-dependent glycerol-3-phosphate dehydrogenase [unclassified Dehalobacter]|uniref:NAD(P)H-dependent glycerol-3-phosphate dehydrogenase n=1 Tax=unclassified Dehalobacter TaxID=2635733 RepID=UPI00028B63BF|nr:MULTISPECIES: NAD(P)H-dependent glycerol-3-phosphate dehydrogenase [unclassified Dehalobacter]AFV02014.1 Glycerol-3-phosphate dehydrogenase [Dehalobacter sp. DCA]AFV05049.1 Glycerol-3-phosphate dehydrogenase [Dehalobacter sp. CF]